MERVGAVRKPTTWPKTEQWKTGKQEQREQSSSSSYWLTSNLEHGSGVQSFLLQKPQQIRGKKTILTLQHDFSMPNSSSGPWMTLSCQKHTHKKEGEGEGERKRQGRNWEGSPARSDPVYWPPPSIVPVGLHSPKGSAEPSWAPSSRVCHCWAESGCPPALLLTVKGIKTVWGFAQTAVKATRRDKPIKEMNPNFLSYSTEYFASRAYYSFMWGLGDSLTAQWLTFPRKPQAHLIKPFEFSHKSDTRYAVTTINLLKLRGV